MFTEEIITYSITTLFVLAVVVIYVLRGKRKSDVVKKKVEIAKEEGKFEPVSLHPYIDTNICIGSGACIRSCPEKDILGIIDGKATVINASNCIGHGACFIACPVDAISLRIGTEKRGVDLPHVKPSYETNMDGIFIAGELGGMGLIKNSTEQGIQAVENIIKRRKTENSTGLDLVIIGAGPAGIAASLTAKKHGLKFKTLEQNSLGGTVFTFPRMKVVMTKPMDLPLVGKIKLVNTSKQELLDVWNNALTKNNITIEENCKVENIGSLEHGYQLTLKDGSTLDTDQVLIAIGRRGTPRKLGVKGEELSKVAYRLLEPETISGQKIMVVGGGDSAIESALLLTDENEVHLSYRQANFARIKKQNEVNLETAIRAGKLKVWLNSNLSEITDQNITLAQAETGEHTLENDRVFIFAGGELPTEFLKNAGISVEKSFGKTVKKH
ncbi:MAG: NAD(P)-binding domain-containing protein [Crocinitomicaceae bacterium]